MTHHIGYITLGEFLQAVDWVRPINAALVTTTGAHDKYHLHLDLCHVLLSQPADTGDALHYWRFNAGRFLMNNGQPADESSYDKTVDRAKSAFDAVLAYLHQNEFIIARAVVAWPKDLIYFDGSTDLIVYDKESDRYILCESAPVEARMPAMTASATPH